ncbi:putative transmembrane domain-containing protein [Cryptosporidium canis]|nr:putative transmembrane domain-containing protein [Cryptosporidium canis]
MQMKELQNERGAWSGARNTKDLETSPEIKEMAESISQKRHTKRVTSCFTYLLIAAVTTIALILIFIILDRSGRNAVQVYFQEVPPKMGESLKPNYQRGAAESNIFVEKNTDSAYPGGSESEGMSLQGPNSGHYQSVMELYMNRLFVTPLNKMSLTIPINDQTLRSYQVEAIDYSTNDEMVFHLSLGHQLKINNETMILYDKSMNEINHFPTYSEEEDRERGRKPSESEIYNQRNETESKLRNTDKRRLQQLQHEYYNYTSTSEWNHKPEVVNNIIPTYYPRNPYIPPYGNPYYFAPNILVPYVYIY